jgi:AAHS family benzoate transporter-like MFS transporter
LAKQVSDYEVIECVEEQEAARTAIQIVKEGEYRMNMHAASPAPHGSEEQLTRSHIIMFIICCAIVTGEGYNLFLYGAVLPVLVVDWGLTSSQAGLIGSASLAGMAVGSVFLGQIADRVGRKKALYISVLLYSLFTLLCGFAPEVLTFSLCRFICGIGIGGALPGVTALIADHAPPRLKSAMVSLALCGMQVGGLLGPAASITVMENYGWRAVLWLGGIALLILPFMRKFLPDTRPAKIESKAPRKKSNILQVGRKRNHILLWIAYFMNLLVMYGLGTWLPYLMIRGGNSLDSSLVITIFLNLGCIIGTFICAAIVDKKIQLKTLVLLMFLIAAAALASLGFSRGLPVQLLIISVVGSCTYGTQNLMNAYVSQYYPPEIRSGGLGWCNGIGRTGAIFGTVFWGFMLEKPLSLSVLFLIFALPSLIACVSFWLVREMDLS